MTTLKKFPHQKFMEENGIDVSSLPNFLQKRIRGFEELQEDYEHTVEEDQQELLDKMETLSYELEEELEEEFEDRLENNEEEEEEEEEGETGEEPKEEVIPEPVKEEKVEEEIPKEPSDEDVIRELYENKLRKIEPSQLKGKGFKGTLAGRRIEIGKFCLFKGKYDVCYTIILKAQ